MEFLSSFSKKTSSPRTSVATSTRIQNILRMKQLDPMPVQAAQAFQLASNPRATTLDFVEVIEADEVLSSRIIRIANSVYFFRGHPVADIEKAVANIGLDELRCILSAAMLKSLAHSRHPAREQVWANAVSTAIGARILVKYTNHIDPGEAFLCGLVHDVGKLVMIQRGGDLYAKVLALVGSGEKSFLDAEEEIFDLNHVEVGKWVSELWNFPQCAIETIEGHHQNIPKVRGELTLPLLVKIADIFSHTAGIGHPAGFTRFRQAMNEQYQKALLYLAISPKEAEEFLKKFEAQFHDEYHMYQLESIEQHL